MPYNPTRALCLPCTAASDTCSPREVDEAVALALDIASSSRLVIRPVRDLKVVLAQRAHDPQLVRSIGIENQRSKPAKAAPEIVDHFGCRRLQAEIGAVAVEAGVVGKAPSVIAEAQLIVGLVEAAVAGHQLGLAVPLKTGTRHHVEHAVGAVA